MQDKTKLEKLLNDNRAVHAETGMKPGEHIDSEIPMVDNSTDNQSQINELEAKVNSLTEALEATKHVTNELDKLKGVFIFFLCTIKFKIAWIAYSMGD